MAKDFENLTQDSITHFSFGFFDGRPRICAEQIIDECGLQPRVVAAVRMELDHPQRCRNIAAWFNRAADILERQQQTPTS